MFELKEKIINFLIKYFGFFIIFFLVIVVLLIIGSFIDFDNSDTRMSDGSETTYLLQVLN